MSDLPPPLVASKHSVDSHPMPIDTCNPRATYSLLYLKEREFRALIRLKCEAWKSRPASSLLDDDLYLASKAGYSLCVWKRIRQTVLSGWVKCSDNRLYDPFLAERANLLMRKKAVGHSRRLADVTSKEWMKLRIAVFQRDNFTCRYCANKAQFIECDHVIPVSAGGASTLDNLVTACAVCNALKRDMLPPEYA